MGDYMVQCEMYHQRPLQTGEILWGSPGDQLQTPVPVGELTEAPPSSSLSQPMTSSELSAIELMPKRDCDPIAGYETPVTTPDANSSSPDALRFNQGSSSAYWSQEGPASPASVSTVTLGSPSIDHLYLGIGAPTTLLPPFADPQDCFGNAGDFLYGAAMAEAGVTFPDSQFAPPTRDASSAGAFVMDKFLSAGPPP
ncbi:uncharacterized protein LOC126109535 [Schistocerca cancellata]|uniref:uncharacterized protein LOC126109535 n=1 Tax=Schistocerca cancellata TaxID=274614 RepID=UPI00211826C1|nr:uncharacterized protein LOC126109535 [Schistocerca cancellata]